MGVCSLQLMGICSNQNAKAVYQTCRHVHLFLVQQRERQAEQSFGLDDDFYLPISHRANDPLETSGIELATVDTAVPESNKGFQMLRAMGWREGQGLGRNKDGAR